MLFTKLKTDQLHARKQSLKVKALLLTTILGDLQKLEKDGAELSDTKVVSVLKKYKESAMQMVQHNVPTAAEELDIIEAYLPKQMEVADLELVIKTIIEAGATNVGLVMKQLQTNYAGLYDGKMAQTIIKNTLTA